MFDPILIFMDKATSYEAITLLNAIINFLSKQARVLYPSLIFVGKAESWNTMKTFNTVNNSNFLQARVLVIVSFLKSSQILGSKAWILEALKLFTTVINSEF